jgi:hypothetical protein
MGSALLRGPVHVNVFSLLNPSNTTEEQWATTSSPCGACWASNPRPCSDLVDPFVCESEDALALTHGCWRPGAHRLARWRGKSLGCDRAVSVVLLDVCMCVQALPLPAVPTVCGPWGTAVPGPAKHRWSLTRIVGCTPLTPRT